MLNELAADDHVAEVTVLLLCYNQQDTIEDAIRGCLDQDFESLFIIVSDDASTDDSFRVIRTVVDEYRGRHRVISRRNDRNLGIAEHYNLLCGMTRSPLLVTAAGDDVSEPWRVSRLYDAWVRGDRQADLITSHVLDVSVDGRTLGVRATDDLSSVRGVADWRFRGTFVIGAAHAFTRRMVDRFGPMDARVHYEDQIQWFRALTGGGGLTVPEPLVRYRLGGTSGRPALSQAQAYLRFTRREAERTVAEIEQLRADARVAGCESLVISRTAEPLERSVFILEVLGAAGLVEKVLAMVRQGGLRSFWKFRKFLSLAFPSVVAVIKRAKA